MAWRKAFGLGVPKDQWVTAPIQCFLVEHPSAGAVLIDTGFHASVAVKPRSNLGAFGTVVYRDIDMRPGAVGRGAAARRGASSRRRWDGVMTHLHPDHASAIADLPGGDLPGLDGRVGGGRGRRPARRLREAPVRPRLRLPAVDFDSDAANSFSGFARAFDVFGDGSVRVVFTPGHTLGHMSVVLRTESGEVLVAGDAIFMHRTLDDDHLPHLLADEHLFRRSLREIRQYVQGDAGRRRSSPGTTGRPGRS